MLPLRDDNPTRRRAIVTLALIALNVGVYFLVQPQGADVEAESRTVLFNYEWAAIPCEITRGEPLPAEELAEAVRSGDVDCDEGSEGGEPLFPDKRPWLAVLSSMFFHGGLAHLGFNMLFLWIFGNNIEDHLGVLRFIGFYLVAGLVATLAHVVLQPDSAIPLVGASGAIAGVMGAYLVWFPRVKILALVFVLLIPITARWLLGYWFVSQFFINPNEGVAWAAHVGGFVFGALVALLVRGTVMGKRAAFRPQRREEYEERYGSYPGQPGTGDARY